MQARIPGFLLHPGSPSFPCEGGRVRATSIPLRMSPLSSNGVGTTSSVPAPLLLEKGGGRAFLKPPLPPLPKPHPSFPKAFILIESLIPTLAAHDRYGFESFFLLESTQRHRQKSPSAYEGGPFFITTIGNRDSIKSKVFGRGGDGVWGRGGETFLKKSFSSPSPIFFP